MPKLIISESRELVAAKAEIEQLKAKNRELAAENIKLKTYIKRNNLKLPGTKVPQITTKDISNEKHYLTPTVASRNRFAKTDLQPTAENQDIKRVVQVLGKRYQYKDGNCIRLYETKSDWWQRFGVTTLSSDNKTRPPILKQALGDNRNDDQDESRLRVGVPSYKLETIEEESVTTEPTEYGGCCIKDAISKRSCLDKNLEEELDQVPLKSEILYDHLRRALKLSREILFNGFTLYVPEAVDYMQGVHEFGLGRTELLNCCLYRLGRPGPKIAGRVVGWRTLRSKFGYISDLRNAFCHFKTHAMATSLVDYDRKFRVVQELAAIFGNEHAAFQARAIRDSFARHAQESSQEIEALWLLSQLPGECRYAWKKHHLRKFCNVSRKDWNDDKITMAERIAEDWQEHRFGETWESFW